MKQETSIVFPS